MFFIVRDVNFVLDVWPFIVDLLFVLFIILCLFLFIFGCLLLVIDFVSVGDGFLLPTFIWPLSVYAF